MRPKRDSSYGCIKALLLLGRVSNLPTVWSNCLAAWLLAGGALVESPDVQRFVWLIVGATLLFLAGMFLNDAFDVQFDREHRPERPIPSGAISVKSVWVLGIGQLLLGLGCLVCLNTLATLCAIGLAGSILLYDWLHKRTAWSPLLMGLCRLFLYLLAGATATGSLGLTVVLSACCAVGVHRRAEQHRPARGHRRPGQLMAVLAAWLAVGTRLRAAILGREC